MGKMWSKLARKAVRKGICRRVRLLLAAALQERPDSAISVLRAEVAKKVGVSFEGKHRFAVDRALAMLTRKPTAKFRAKKRFALAVSRR